MSFQRRIIILLSICTLFLAGAVFLTLFSLKKSSLINSVATTQLEQDSTNNGIKTVQVLNGNVVEGSSSTPSSFEKQPGKKYPITDGETYRILAGRKYVCEDTFWADSAHVEILVMRVNGKWTELFRAKDLGDNNCFSIMSIYEKSIRLSPLEDYVEFSLVGYEWSEDMLINTKTKKNIFPQDMHSSGLVWSKNARNFAFVSNLEEFGGSGVDEVVVSGFNNPDVLVDVLKLESWAKGEDAYNLKYEFRDLFFVDNQNIQFSIHRVYDEDNSKFFGEIARYQYDLEKAKLTKLSGE